MFFQQSLISEDFSQVTEAELRDLVFVMRKKLVRRDAVIQEQQQLMEHFILNERPTESHSPETKRNKQPTTYKQKLSKLDTELAEIDE